MLSSCAPYRFHDYRVANATGRDAAKVKQLLRGVAAEAGLAKTFPTPYDSPVIAMYGIRSVQLRASHPNQDVRVVVIRYDYLGSRPFSRTDRLVRRALSEAFGPRFVIEPRPQTTRVVTVY